MALTPTEASGRQPTRSCVACRKTAPKQELVRFVLGPDQTIVMDFHGKLPGRGAWLCPDKQCFELARKRKGFGRAFKTGVVFEAKVAFDRLQEQADQALGQSVGLARKAGRLIVGGDEVERALDRASVQLVLLATDVSERTRRRFETLARVHDVKVAYARTKTAWGETLAKAPCGVLAVTESAFAEKCYRYSRWMASAEDSMLTAKKDVVDE